VTADASLPLFAPRPSADDDALPPGARVVIRDEEWIIRATHRSSVGGHAVEVVGLSELVRNQPAVFLTKLDPVTRLRPESTTLVHDPTPGFRRARLYLESLLRRTPPTDEGIHIGHLAAATPLAYQLEPAAKALGLPRARILIADDVGLGKTIEVGVLLAELIRRAQGRRILVVTLKSLLGQFQRELWHRFTIPLVALDSAGIERMRTRIPATTNPFHVFDRVIVSVDTLKKDTRYRHFLERARWDVVVVDECQNVAVRGAGSRRSQRARLASLLADTSDALILTSATPHDGTPESFASLVNLLDPTAIADPSRYQRDDVKALFVRRFKKDVAHEVRHQFSARLPPRLDVVDASPPEDVVFSRLATASFPTLDRHRSGATPLFRTTLLKAFLSSPAACRATLEERSRTLSRREDPDAVADRALLAELAGLAAAVDPEVTGAWPKLERLLTWLAEAGWKGRGALGERVVVFSERIDTLEVLRTLLTARLGLEKRPDTVALFHGALKDTRQDEVIRDFGVEDGRVRILLASDAASEGINLHYFCHRLVHFDIPWSLMTLEQRNGRVDRFGQRHAPDLRYLLTRPSDPGLRGDLRVLDRLIERERYVHENLGDAAWLMRCFDPAKEESLVADAIERHLAPEALLPDVPAPGDDILALLTAPASPAAGPVAPPTRPTFSLYADDLAFARHAFDEVGDEDPARRPEFLPDVRGFVLEPPADLQRVLPRALRRAKQPLRLTVDRDRVVAAIEQARTRKDALPEWELFWPLHPVAEWLCDRVLTAFARHEAPVLEVAKGLAPDEAAFVYQGILANLRGDARVVAWFAVVRGAGEGTRIVPLDQLARAVGLDGALSNANAAHRLPNLTALVPETVRVAEGHLATLRKAREESVKPKLVEESRRVAKWRDNALDAIDNDERALGRAPRADERRRFEERRAAVERAEQARRAWVEEGLRTVDAPVLRLAAVIVPKEARA